MRMRMGTGLSRREARASIWSRRRSAMPGAIADDLAAALNATDIAAVLLRLGEGDERGPARRAIEALRILIQSNGAALLLDGHPELVAPRRGRRRAPGRNRRAARRDARPQAEISSPAAAALRRATTPCWLANRAPTTSCSASRIATATARRFDAVLERVAWWAEIFQIPCVGYAARVEEVEALAQAGADFVAIGETIWRDRRSFAAAVDALARARGARAMRWRGLLILRCRTPAGGRRMCARSRCRSRRRPRGRRRAFRRRSRPKPARSRRPPRPGRSPPPS